MSNTSAIAFAGIVVASFLSVSAWSFPAAPVDSRAAFDVILAAGQSKETLHCARGTHFSSRAGQCLRNCHLNRLSHAGLQIC